MKKKFLVLILLVNCFATFAQLKVISNGNVGIGVTNPQRKLHMNDELLLGPKTGVPYAEGIKFTRSQNFPTNPAEWAFDTDGSGFNIWKPYPSSNYGNFKLFIADATGNVGINTGTPSYKLDVNGTFRCYGFTNSSDSRLKSNIKEIKSALDVILKLVPKIYDLTIPTNDQSTADKSKMKGSNDNNKSKQEVLLNQAGLVAQELQTILPNLVSEDNKGYLGINYIGLIPYLIQAFKEQNSIVKEQSILIEQQGKKIEQLKNELENCCSKPNLLNGSTISDRKLDNNYSTPMLEQNNPNPFSQQTQIAYYIPENCNNTSLHIYDLNAVELKAIDIYQKGKGNITIEANSLKAGMYLYNLICDGKEIATKKMILTSK